MLTKEQNNNILSNKQLNVQPKLEIGEEGDEHEKEADEVAGKVMRMSSGDGGDPVMNTGTKTVSMTDNSNKLNRTINTGTPKVQRMSTQNRSGISVPSTVEKGIQSSKGKGQNLSPEVQQEMGNKIGSDFSNVKVHTDSNAAEMSKDINAKAFTYGNDIYFNKGQYNPDSNNGKQLLAHELTHTIQQSGQIKPKIQKQTLTNAANLIAAGNIDAGLADPDMRLAFSTVAAGGGTKSMNVAGMETVLGQVIANGLGVTYIPPVTGNPSFSQYTILQRSSIAFVLGMIKQRQTYMETYNAYLTNPAANVDPNVRTGSAPTDFMNTSLNYTTVLNAVRLGGTTTVPDWAFNMISENPDLSVMQKAMFLSSLTSDLGGTGINPPASPNVIGSGTAAARADANFLNTFLPQILNDQNRVKVLIDAQAQLMFAQMGAPVGTPMGESLLASSGDTGTSSGLFGSGDTRASQPVGVGYFMYSASTGIPTEQGLVGNNLTVNYATGQTTLEISLNAYGFNASSTLTLTITAPKSTGADTLTITINGQPNRAGSTTTSATPGSIPGITVTPSAAGNRTGASILFTDNTHNFGNITINVARGLAVTPGAITNADEVQLMVTTTGNLGNIVQPLDAKELFESGSFISKSIPTLQSSSRKSNHNLADKIVEFSNGLNITAIQQALSASQGATDASRFFKLEGKGINQRAPIPQKFRDDNPGLNDTALLKKIEQLDQVKLTSYYKSDSRYSALDYDGIIAMLETYRSSQATATGSTINITSTTDPQGTGVNPGANNDFPDYFNEYIMGTTFGQAVIVEDVLIFDQNHEVSRNNNDVLSALRSLSFLKLILEQKGLKESDFAKMNVKVTVSGKEVPANLGEIPTEASASRTPQDSEDRKKFSTGNVNDYCIQVMAGPNPGPLNDQKAIYDSRGWTSRLEPASGGNTRLVVEGFANVNDAMAKLIQIRSEGRANAFVKTKTN